jgi:hypothetical protein
MPFAAEFIFFSFLHTKLVEYEHLRKSCIYQFGLTVKLAREQDTELNKHLG